MDSLFENLDNLLDKIENTEVKQQSLIGDSLYNDIVAFIDEYNKQKEYGVKFISYLQEYKKIMINASYCEWVNAEIGTAIKEANKSIYYFRQMALKEIRNSVKNKYSLRDLEFPFIDYGKDSVDTSDIDVSEIIAYIVNEYPDIENLGIKQHKEEVLRCLSRRDWGNDTYFHRVSIKNNKLSLINSVSYSGYERFGFELNDNKYLNSLAILITAYLKRYFSFSFVDGIHNIDFSSIYEHESVSVKFFKNRKIDLIFKDNVTALGFYNYVGFVKNIVK